MSFLLVLPPSLGILTIPSGEVARFEVAAEARLRLGPLLGLLVKAGEHDRCELGCR